MQTNLQITSSQIEDAVAKAYDAISDTSKRASSSGITQSVADALTKYSSEIQGAINRILSNRGAITQQQLDELDEKIREAKRKSLEAKSKDTLVKYGLYISAALATFGVLWIIVRKK